MNLEDRRLAELRRLESQVQALESAVSTRRARYAGLVELGDHHRLIRLKVELAKQLLSGRRGASQEVGAGRGDREAARRQFRQALGLYEEIQHANVSVEQEEQVRGSEENLSNRGSMAALLARHADVLLEPVECAVDVVAIVARAIRKYAGPEERYEPLVVKEEVPAALRGLVEGVLGHLMEARRSEEGVGVEEEQEKPEFVISRSMVMPLSQAILYYEEELISQAEESLRRAPGDPILQRLLRRRRQEAAAMRDLQVRPRARPPTWESHLWDISLTQFTDGGEPMIKVPLAVRQRVGTDPERVQELVQMEVVRQLAGKGIDPSLDKDTSGAASLLGQPPGNVDYAAWYRVLCLCLPALGCVADARVFRRLLEAARGPRPERLEQRVAAMVALRDGDLFGRTAGLIESES